MKTQATLLLTIVGLLGMAPLSARAQQNASLITASIDSLRARYAPDHRLAIFDVTCVAQGNAMLVRGEVDNLKAKEEALAAVRKLSGGELVDSIKVLPDAQFGDKKFAIVSCDVGNVRTTPGNASELSTQTLMGTVVKLMKRRGGWYYIQMPDKYLGWLESAVLQVTDAAGVEAWKAAPKVIVTSYFTFVREKPTASALPVRSAVACMLMKKTGTKGQWVAVELPNGDKGFIEKSSVQDYAQWKKSRKLTVDNIEKTAKTFLGIPYLWGGTSTKGVDCSGFTKSVYRLNGMELLRDADEMGTMGVDVPPGKDFENLKKGDLVFFGRKGGPGGPERITHVGISLGKTEYINSAGGWVRLNSFDPSAALYNESRLRSFIRARRIIGAPQLPEVAKEE